MKNNNTNKLLKVIKILMENGIINDARELEIWARFIQHKDFEAFDNNLDEENYKKVCKLLNMRG